MKYLWIGLKYYLNSNYTSMEEFAIFLVLPKRVVAFSYQVKGFIRLLELVHK